ncbi:MAG: response regulator transcription factor [Spirochaetales bacterium]|nr:response regulator transcription factor [Spirochaetales bacterium]
MPYRIMIVDDDKDFRTVFREILEEEYEVVEAANGDEAISKMRAPNIIDLILLDIRMPGLKGTEVLKKIKEINPDVFIVMLTGYSGKDIILESLRGHADDYLEKPLKVEKTLEIIKNLLAKKNDRVSGVIEKLKYFIEKNYHKEISLKEASRIVYLSPKYISRLFKESTGISFHEYKLRLRMEKAKELLDNSDLTVNEIAYKTGYQNTESFVRIFKKLQECTPSEYRLREKVYD